jgi:hypothetical protein
VAEWRRLLDAAKQGRLADEIGKQLKASGGGRTITPQDLALFKGAMPQKALGKLTKAHDKVKGLVKKVTK